jgi:hypothetical protein
MLWDCTLLLASLPINRRPEPTLKISTSCTANCSTGSTAAGPVNQLSQRGAEGKELQVALCFGSDNHYGTAAGRERKEKINANRRCQTGDYKSHWRRHMTIRRDSNYWVRNKYGAKNVYGIDYQSAFVVQGSVPSHLFRQFLRSHHKCEQTLWCAGGIRISSQWAEG